MTTLVADRLQRPIELDNSDQELPPTIPTNVLERKFINKYKFKGGSQKCKSWHLLNSCFPKYKEGSSFMDVKGKQREAMGKASCSNNDFLGSHTKGALQH